MRRKPEFEEIFTFPSLLLFPFFGCVKRTVFGQHRNFIRRSVGESSRCQRDYFSLESVTADDGRGFAAAFFVRR